MSLGAVDSIQASSRPTAVGAVSLHERLRLSPGNQRAIPAALLVVGPVRLVAGVLGVCIVIVPSVLLQLRSPLGIYPALGHVLSGVSTHPLPALPLTAVLV